MLVYIIGLIFVYLSLMCSKKSKNKGAKIIFIFFAFSVMILIAGLRYSVGTDFLMYEEFFFRIERINLFSENLEFIYILLCKIVHFFTSDSVFLFIVVAIFIYVPIGYVIVKNVKNYELAIFLFITFGFYTSSLNIMRQWMAISMLFLACSNMWNGNKKKMLIYFGLAYLSHYTVLMVLPLFIAVNKIKNNRTRIIIIICSIIMYCSTNFVSSNLLSVMQNFNIGNKYYKYILSFDEISTNIFVMPMFTLVTYIAYLVYMKNKEDDISNKKYNILINLNIFAFSFSLIGTKLMFFERAQYYFLPFMCVLIPEIMNKTKPQIRRTIYVFCIVLGFAFYIYSLYKNGGEPLPYKTIFNK